MIEVTPVVAVVEVVIFIAIMAIFTVMIRRELK